MAALGARQIVPEERVHPTAPELTLLEGRARERRELAKRQQHGVVSRLVAQINPSIALVVGAVIIIAFVFLLRLDIQIKTSAIMMETSSLNKRVTASQHAVDQLQVQHAIFSNPERVRRVASGSLSMVDTNKVAQLDISPYGGDEQKSQMATHAVAQASQVMTESVPAQE